MPSGIPKPALIGRPGGIGDAEISDGIFESIALAHVPR